MKKSLVITLALVFVLGITGAAFAAPANPFVDVPANHWSYSAVSKLAKDGIIDGMGDGTYQGTRSMTRYEMAQIVAKAMVKVDKADAGNQALIKKLEAEFATELNNLGVRVGKLEEANKTLHFNGTLNMRYKATDYDADYRSNAKYNSNSQYRLRLNGIAKVDDKTSFGMRFVNNAPSQNNATDELGLGGNWSNSGTNSDTGRTGIDRIFVNTKVGAVNATIGRQALIVDSYGQLVDTGLHSFDGIRLSGKTGVVNLTAQTGRFTSKHPVLTPGKAVYVGTSADATLDEALDVTSFGLSSKIGNKFDYELGYTQFKASHVLDQTYLNYYYGTVGYAFDSKWFLGGQYGKNTEGIGKYDGGQFGAIKAIYGDRVLNKKGNNNLTIQYSKMAAGSVYVPFSVMDTPGSKYADHVGQGFKLTDINYNYAFSPKFNGQLEWVKVDADYKTENYQYWKATLNASF